MGKYTTNPLRAGQENEKATGLDTLGGEFGLCWNDTVPLTTGARNAFLSAFIDPTLTLNDPSFSSFSAQYCCGFQLISCCSCALYHFFHFSHCAGTRILLNYPPVRPEGVDFDL